MVGLMITSYNQICCLRKPAERQKIRPDMALKAKSRRVSVFLSFVIEHLVSQQCERQVFIDVRIK